MSDSPAASEATGVGPAPLPVSTMAGSTSITQPVGIVNTNTPAGTVTGTTVTVTLTTAPQPQVAMVNTVSQAMTAPVTAHTQVAVTPSLTRIVTTSPQASQLQSAHTPTASAVIRSPIPQGTVQVIQGHPFVQQQYMQQQYYIQSVQAMQAQPLTQQVNLTAVQGRPSSVGSSSQKSPIISATQPGSHATVTWKTMAPTLTTAAGTQTAKGKTMIQQQVFGKQVLRGAGGQPLVIGQLGVLSGPNNPQTLVAQPKSPSVSLAPGGNQQVINNPTQIRFTNPPTFVTSQGQILGSSVTPAMLNQLQMATLQQSGIPLATQQVLGSQSAIIGTQPLYLRPAGTIQTPQGLVQTVLPNKGLRQTTDTGSVQMKSTGTQVKTVTPALVKGVANILPQTARPIGQVTASSTMAKGVQTNQIPRVRALKPQVKPTIAQVVPGQPAKIAPQMTTARLLTPTMARPPTVLVQPKQQFPQRTITTTAGQLVTLAAVTTVPVANTQTQTVSQTQAPPEVILVPATSPEKPPTATTQPIPLVSPIKPEPVTTPSEPNVKKPEETMEMEPVTVTMVTAPGVVGAGAGPDKPSPSNNVTKETNHPPPLPPLAPPPLSRTIDRSDRIATVIGERQAAIVKPNVLTHIIEGFVIQEAPEPFPVQRCSALSDFIPGRSSEQENDSAVDQKDFMTDSSGSSTDSKLLESEGPADEGGIKLKCEFCGKIDIPRRFRCSRRFCSRTCAKRYNVGCSRRMGLFKSRKRGTLRAAAAVSRKHKNMPMKKIWKRGKGGRVSTGPLQRSPESSSMISSLTMGNIRTHMTSSQSQEGIDIDTDLGIGMSGLGAPSTISMETTTTTSSESERSTSPSGQDESSSPRSPPELEPEMDLDTMSSCTPRRHLSKWTVQEVVDFVRNLPGCGMYADEFNRQEIDGQALMLLKEDHLMTAMSIKLGPALKICNKINSLKDEVH